MRRRLAGSTGRSIRQRAPGRPTLPLPDPSRMRSKLVVACFIGSICAAGHAACDSGLAERMHAKLHPKRTLDHELALCEPWKALPGRFIVVLPMPQSARESGTARFDLDVLVVQQAD